MLDDKSPAGAEVAGSSRLTFCRNCAAACGMRMTIADNRIVHLEPDRNHPLSGGYFCIKGRMNVELTNGGDGRLTSCQRRMPDGTFEPVGAEQALDDIAARLSEIVSAWGPNSVAVYQATGAYGNLPTTALYKSWMAALGCSNMFSSMTIDQSAKWITASRMGVFVTGKPHLEDVDLLIIAGNNPIVSHEGYPFTSVNASKPAAYLRDAKARGTKLIVIDPRRTETARLADVFVQIKPGEDAVLFAGLIHLLLSRNLHDVEFCDAFVDGVERLRMAVAPFTPDIVAQRCDIPESQLHEIIEMVRSARRVSAGCGTGVCMSRHANLADHLVEAFNALCGGYVRAGDVLRNPGVLNRRPATESVVPPSRSWRSGHKARTADAGTLFGELPTALLPQEILEAGGNRIRVLIVIGGNPAMALGEPERTRQALEQLDLLVVLDPRMTETGRLAHYVIAPTLPFERHDITAFAENFFWKPFVQYTAPMLKAPPGVIDDWAFFWGLASRMGLQLVFKKPQFGMKFSDIPGGWALDMHSPPAIEELYRWICEQSGVEFEELQANPGGLLCDQGQIIVSARPTDEDARLDICPYDVASEIEEVAAELAAMDQNAADEAFPYLLIVRRLVETYNSMYRGAETTLRRYPGNPIFMNPQDMEKLGLEVGSRVRVASKNGRLTAPVIEDPTLRRGVVSMSHLFGDEGHTGHLVSITHGLQPISFMPLQTGVSVSIERSVI